MKTIFTYAGLIVLYVLSAGCSSPIPALSIDMAILCDITDEMAVYPTADEITSQLGLKANPWQSVRITVTFITNKDIDDIKVVSLDAENQWTGNLTLRKAKIQHFKKELAQCLAVKYNKSLTYSIIYRTIAQQANRLATSTPNNRFLLVYSDLSEHTPDISFYDPQTITKLQKSPQSVAQQLEATLPLKQLNGLQLWLLYNPATYKQNNAYMPIAEFYQHLFSAHGATTHIANKFTLL